MKEVGRADRHPGRHGEPLQRRLRAWRNGGRLNLSGPFCRWRLCDGVRIPETLGGQGAQGLECGLRIGAGGRQEDLVPWRTPSVATELMLAALPARAPW